VGAGVLPTQHRRRPRTAAICSASRRTSQRRPCLPT
jgi:hypothetical protein